MLEPAGLHSLALNKMAIHVLLHNGMTVIAGFRQTIGDVEFKLWCDVHVRFNFLFI